MTWQIIYFSFIYILLYWCKKKQQPQNNKDF